MTEPSSPCVANALLPWTWTMSPSPSSPSRALRAMSFVVRYCSASFASEGMAAPVVYSPGRDQQMQIAANIEVQGQVEILDASRRSPAKVIAPDAVHGLPHLSRPAVDRHVIPCALYLSPPIQKPILEQVGLHDRLARDPEMAGAAARAIALDGIGVRPHPCTALQ